MAFWTKWSNVPAHDQYPKIETEGRLVPRTVHESDLCYAAYAHAMNGMVEDEVEQLRRAIEEAHCRCARVLAS